MSLFSAFKMSVALRNYPSQCAHSRFGLLRFSLLRSRSSVRKNAGEWSSFPGPRGLKNGGQFARLIEREDAGNGQGQAIRSTDPTRGQIKAFNKAPPNMSTSSKGSDSQNRIKMRKNDGARQVNSRDQTDLATRSGKRSTGEPRENEWLGTSFAVASQNWGTMAVGGWKAT
ncbi:hypothetical protein VTK73DRAFT_48 [Phialemonium thermophilum]|uniref:Uncharacterized protein n=1 Tax=Phialemonium thermophilum TaxID=223376 RepID=A0ABR3Y8I8_9PEZI